MQKNFNKKPIVIKKDNEVIISFNGRKLIKPINEYENLSEEEIADNFAKEVKFCNGQEK